MTSVTGRIKVVKQPYGGYLPPKNFQKESLGEGIDALHPNEDVHAGLVGMAVDYLTRLQVEPEPIHLVFSIAYRGAAAISDLKTFNHYASLIKGLDDRSIDAAIRLAGYDSIVRAGLYTVPVNDINVTPEAIANIRTMVKRTLNFYRIYGKPIEQHLIFPGAYTDLVTAGDGDCLLKGILVDIKTTKGKLTSKTTLQLLMYWRMMLRTEGNLYPNPVHKLGIFNPRTNIFAYVDTASLSEDMLQTVDTEVIGYML